MKIFFISFAFSLLMINSRSIAAVDPMSFVGHYHLGECSLSGFTSVVVFPSALTNAKGLTVNLFNNSVLTKSTFVALQAFNTINFTYIQVVVDTFNITNILYTTNSIQAPVLNYVKLGRSASGGRARLIELNQFGSKTFECVFYK